MRAGASVDDPPSSARHLPGRARHVPRRLRALAPLPPAAILCWLYLRQSLAGPVNSDGAANVLQARSILDGNPLLHGWWTSDVSFYTTELPEYTLVTALRGVSPEVVHLCGALTYTLTVLLAAALARGRTPGPPGWTRAALAAGLLLAPAILGGTEVYLENPDHAGTAVPVLALLLLLDRAGDGGRRWPLPAAACALLTVAQFGDQLTLLTATFPVAAVCAVLALAECQRRLPGERWNWRVGGCTGPGRLRFRPLLSWPFALSTRWGRPSPASGGAGALAVAPVRVVCAFGRFYRGLSRYRPARGGPSQRDAGRSGREGGGRRLDAALLAAAVASIILAALAARVLRALGGFDRRPLAGVALAPLSQFPARAGTLWRAILLLFGAGQPGQPRQPQTIRAHPWLVLLADLHAIGLAVAVAGLVAGAVLVLSGRADRVTAILVTATAALLAAGLFTTVLRSLSNAHEIAPLLPLAAALAGRALPAPRRALPASAAIAWLALNLAGLCYAATWPAAGQPQQPVAAWLTAHHQHAGLSGYWQASATTVASGGRVTVAPIVIQQAPGAGIGSAGTSAARTNPAGTRSARIGAAGTGSARTSAGRTSQPGACDTGGRAAADRWESSSAWYQPAARDATFVLAVADPAAPGGGLSVAEAQACFGPPAAEHRIGSDVILLYRYNLLTRVAGTAFPGP